MARVLKFKKPKPSVKHRGNTLCRRGFHKWEILGENRFDSKQGRLVTAYRCKRCGKLRNEAR